MLATLDLDHLLTFPIKEAGAHRRFLTGVLVYLAAQPLVASVQARQPGV